MPESGDDEARLPQALRNRLEAFPIEEVRDSADRLAGRLLETAGRMMRSGRVWLSNRRVSVRRGRWEQLLS